MVNNDQIAKTTQPFCKNDTASRHCLDLAAFLGADKQAFPARAVAPFAAEFGDQVTAYRQAQTSAQSGERSVLDAGVRCEFIACECFTWRFVVFDRVRVADFAVGSAVRGVAGFSLRLAFFTFGLGAGNTFLAALFGCCGFRFALLLDEYGQFVDQAGEATLVTFDISSFLALCCQLARKLRQQGGTLGFFLLQDGVLFACFGRDFIEFLFGVLYFGLVFLDGCQVGTQRFRVACARET